MRLRQACACACVHLVIACGSPSVEPEPAVDVQVAEGEETEPTPTPDESTCDEECAEEEADYRSQCVAVCEERTGYECGDDPAAAGFEVRHQGLCYRMNAQEYCGLECSGMDNCIFGDENERPIELLGCQDMEGPRDYE